MDASEIKRLRKSLKLSQSAFADLIDSSLRTIQNYEKGNTRPPADALIKLQEIYKNAQDDAYSNEVNEPKTDYKTKKNRVPVYEIDVTSSIVSSFSDIKEIPSYYMDYEPFNDCDAVVTNYGDSMYPDYKNGERLAVKKIVNFDVLNWGETYLVITDAEANDLKTVKRVHPHEDNDKIILRAGNPRYAGDTVIFKTNVLALFAVKGKVSQNFI